METEPAAEQQPILVVEDDRSFLDLIERTLERGGFECLRAHSGEEGLALALARRPRAAIVDGLLPGMRGDELVRRLRHHFDRQALPILFVSAFFRDLRSFRHLTGECAVSLVLHKPISPEELLAALVKELALQGGKPPADEVLTEIHVDFSVEIAELLPDYLEASSERLAAMRGALRQLGTAEEEGAREVLRAESHKLHGSGASFGLPGVSRIAGAIEASILEAGRPLAPTLRARLSGLVAALGVNLSGGARAAPISTEPGVPVPSRIVLVDGPTELAASCGHEAAGAGIELFGDEATALEALRSAERRPSLVLVAADRPEIDAPGLCSRLRAAGVSPVAVISGDGTLPARLQAIEAGALHWLARPPDAASLLAAGRSLAPSGAGVQALAVDEDPQLLARLAPAFALLQMALQPCLDPEEAFDHPAAPSEAGLVLVGPNLSRCGQLELVRALRADQRFASAPLMVLAREAEGEPGRWRERQLEALEAGADLLADSSLCPEALAAEARSLADRVAVRRRAPLRDPLTGLWLRPWLEEACARSLGLARRAGRVLSLLVFDYDAEALMHSHGRAVCTTAALALAAQLRSAFRATDLLARLGPGRFAALLDDVTGPAARALLDAQLQSFGRRPFGVTDPAPIAVRGALATFPEIDADGPAFVRAAEDALACQ